MQYRGEMRYDEPMSRHTTWRIGGPAQRFYRPADVEDLVEFLRLQPSDEPIFWLGLGSNLLVRDGGIRGTVISLKGCLDGIHFLSDQRVYVEAGAACPIVARSCADAGLGGAEYLAGIPGTMGGALAMNAGALGSETWQIVRSVSTVDSRGKVRQRTPDDFDVAYRSVRGPAGEWFLAAELQLTPREPDTSRGIVRELLDRRAATQPSNQPTCGSVFKNPPEDFAARLIEACGLKGHCVGAACVSRKHANFIVNQGGATAVDVETLIAEIAARVLQQFGVALQCEVLVVGEPGGNA